MMIGLYVRTSIHGQHREGFAQRTVPPDASDTEPLIVGHREKPFVQPLLFGIEWIGELVEAVGQNETAVCAELSAFSPEIIDRLAVPARPAPSAVDQFANTALAFNTADDGSHVGHPDVLARRNIRRALRHVDLDLEALEILGNRGNVDQQPVVIAHPSSSQIAKTCPCRLFPVCSCHEFESNPIRLRCTRKSSRHHPAQP